MYCNRHQQGFTLLEVLVAVFILAVSMTALLQASHAATKNQRYLLERIQAQWVANDQLLLLQLSGITDNKRRLTGTRTLAGQTWHWTAEINATDNPVLARVVIAVSGQQQQQRATVTGYVRSAL